jgi:Flp pilus assembly protein TadG
MATKTLATKTLLAHLRNRLQSRLQEFRTANAANVTVTFALATIPMVGFVGAAVDYSHANAVKAAMQAAADSTALMLSKDASSMTATALSTKANDYFKALYTRGDSTNLLVSATYNNTNGSQVVVNASANVKTNFMGIMGFSSLKVAVDSQTKWGNTKLRVALVLDNTGSMSDDGKIDALKTATKSLLTQLKSAAAKDGDVYVSIIPFVKDVNVGSSNYKATWIDWTDFDENEGTCSKDTRRKEYTKSGCAKVNGNWTATPHSQWNGCVVDRGNSTAPSTYNTDQNVTGVDITKTYTMFAAEQYDYCPAAAVMPLSYDWTGMNNLVTNMSPNGNTNQGIGLQHGWMSLVGGGPYPTPPAEDPNYKYWKVIILLTDGLNTQNRWYTDQTSIDTRQATTCANVKAAGITLYTVQVNTGGDPTSTLLQTCASTSDKFFLLTSASQMVSTFSQIGTALSNLRIAQ